MTKFKPASREMNRAIDLVALYLRDNGYLEAVISKDGSTFLRREALPHERMEQKRWNPTFPSTTMPDAN